ncbi:hypothetical protein CHLRE_03g158400v5 [Chlamydomonas reinhardtii]|uniref:RING-type domain-containing protein n=1 Tax=Chlamydomonas reinhardtii TaxID=3055 RepID=A0A2K3DW76_CHLRE|nr:uncharacterized protein CHLRE_03g158400v5 [Chlamydomonas reinhardtii]PNW84779.1 hypothetical protein CHLRE_03g158400v5 [Chlamydomonas reinhardtii]
MAYRREARPDDGLREELRDCQLQLVSVQRNYDGLSRLMQSKQQEVEQAQAALAAEQAAVRSIATALEDSRAGAAALERQLAELRPLTGQLAELQTTHETTKSQLGSATALNAALQETIRGLRSQLEDERHRSERQRQQLESWRKAETGHDAELAGLKQQLAVAQGDCRAVTSELRSAKDALARSQAAQQAEAQRAAGLAAKVTGHEDTIRAMQDDVRRLNQLTNELRSAVRAGEVAMVAAHGTQGVLEAQLRGAARAADLQRQAAAELEGRIAGLEAQLAEGKAAAEAKEAEVVRLRSLLAHTEEQLQASLGGRLAADEVSNGLQMQLAQTRGQVAEARRVAVAAEAEMARVVDEATEAVRLAEGRAAASAHAMSAMQYRATEAGNLLGTRVDGCVERLMGRLAERLGRGMAAEAERMDKAITVTQQKLQGWEADLVDMESELLGVGNALDALSAAAVRRQAEREREVDSVKGDAAALRARAEELEAALASEAAARQLLASSKAALEEQHRESIKALEAAADDRVEAERQRLGARLTAVEAEVSRLTQTHHREAVAAGKVWEQERQKLTRRIHDLQEEVQKHKDGPPPPPQVPGVDANALAVLHTQLNADLQAAKDDYELRLRSYKEQIEKASSNIRFTWSTCTKLATDLALVARHLAGMGVALPEGAGELPPGLKGVADEGSGDLVGKLASALRLSFGLLAEGVQNMVRKLQMLQQANLELEAKASAIDPAAWSAVAVELRGTVAKLVHIEDSLAPPCTCLMCLDIFKAPVTLIPCGHTFCRKCLANANGLCTECGADTPAVMTISNAPLDAICAKYELKRSALTAIQRALTSVTGGGGAVAAGAGKQHGGGALATGSLLVAAQANFGGFNLGAGVKGPAGAGVAAARAIGAGAGSTSVGASRTGASH